MNIIYEWTKYTLSLFRELSPRQLSLAKKYCKSLKFEVNIIAKEVVTKRNRVINQQNYNGINYKDGDVFILFKQ